MKRNPSIPRQRAGSALVLTLCFIVLLSGLVVAVIIGMQLDRSNTQGYYQTARVQELANGATEELISDLKDEIAAGSLPDPNNNIFSVNGKQIFVPNTAAAPATAPAPYQTTQPARIGFTLGTSTTSNPPGDYATDVDANHLPPTVVRVSRAAVADQTAIFPTIHYDTNKLPPQRGSPVSSVTRSANGRTISPNRWASTGLMSSSLTTAPKHFYDTTPNGNKTPDWVYLTRSGGRKYTDADAAKDATDPASLKPSKDLDHTQTLVGRYAFVMYDEGGLLDVNSAGYPSTLDTDTTNGGLKAVRAKSSAAYAAISSLPGMTGKVDNLVNWRSSGSIAAASGSFLAAADAWIKTGFLTVKSGDNPLLSRKDLIAYFSKNVGTTTALPYLGTFSRALLAPSVQPATPVEAAAGSTYDYAKFSDPLTTDAANLTVINRDLANVRYAADGTVKHYADDATSKSYAVKKGDQLLQSRFSLARLDWLAKTDPSSPKGADPNTGAGPGSPYAEAIQAAFGLVWDFPGGPAGSGTMANGGNKCWNYVGATGSVANLVGTGPLTEVTIKTLGQVAAENREPDFFELLKAAILNGSLGRSPGRAGFLNGTILTPGSFNAGYFYPWGQYPDPDNGGANRDDTLKKGPVGLYCYTFGPNSTVKAPARIPDVQIMKIGANIIDQYDADSYPTAIYFKYAGVGVNDPVYGASANPIFGPVSMIYGDENLPALATVRQLTASPQRSSTGDPNTGTDLGTNIFASWRQPYLWNAHQQPPAGTTLANRPGNYQIRAYGKGSLTYWSWPGDSATAAGKTYTAGQSYVVDYFTSNNNAEVNDPGTINFALANSTAASSFCFYDVPFPLMENGVTGLTVTTAAGNRGTSVMAFYNQVMPAPYNVPNHFAAFSTGVTPVDATLGEPYKPFYVSDNNGLNGMSKQEDKPTTYILGWTDSSSKFHPYSYITGAFTFASTKLENANQRVGSANPYNGTETWTLIDPRTERFSLGRNIFGSVGDSIDVYFGQGGYSGWYPCGRPRAEEGFGGQGFFAAPSDYTYPLSGLMVNSVTDARDPTADDPSTVQIAYYSGYGGGSRPGYSTDIDGVVRPGDGYYGNPATGDGIMTFISNGTPNPNTSVPVGDTTNSSHGRRPVILNRTFRSVGELGYVFRDLPFKTMDLFSAKSADTALLDVFCLNDIATVASDGLTPLAAGRVNINAAPVPVIKALLQRGAKKEWDQNYNLNTEVAAIANTISTKIMQTNTMAPLDGYRGLAPALVLAMRTATATSSSGDKANKAYLEAPIRALSESTDFRTWNLMIDLITQSGQLNPSAKTLSDFNVQGECRVWVHVAIDRYTGKVTARQVEPVYE